jgi:lipopolysaccharide export system permease protein
MISDTRDASQPMTAFARIGMLVNDETRSTVTLRLLDGQIDQSKAGANTFNQTDFGVYDFNLDWASTLADLKPQEKDAKEMTIGELRRAIADKRRAGEPSFVEQVEVHRKFSIPFACLVFAAVGVPLGLQSTRAGRSRGFSVSLALILAYYVLLTLGEKTGERGALPPAFALWLPNIIFATFGTILFVAAAQERRLLPLDRLEHFVTSLRARIVSRLPG